MCWDSTSALCGDCLLEVGSEGGRRVELLKRRVREGVQVRAHGAVCKWKWHFWLVKRGSNGVTSVSHLPMRRLQKITILYTGLPADARYLLGRSSPRSERQPH